MATQRPISMPETLPPHLKEALEADADAKKRVEEAATPPTEEQTDDADERKAAMMSREWTWKFSYTDDLKVVWEGTFTNTFANVKMQRMIGRNRVEKNLGVSISMLDPIVSELNMILAHLEFSLDVKANPENHWARNLEALDDNEVLYALYGEVVEHERTFLGRASFTKAS